MRKGTIGAHSGGEGERERETVGAKSMSRLKTADSVRPLRLIPLLQSSSLEPTDLLLLPVLVDHG